MWLNIVQGLAHQCWHVIQMWIQNKHWFWRSQNFETYKNFNNQNILTFYDYKKLDIIVQYFNCLSNASYQHWVFLILCLFTYQNVRYISFILFNFHIKLWKIQDTIVFDCKISFVYIYRLKKFWKSKFQEFTSAFFV